VCAYRDPFLDYDPIVVHQQDFDYSSDLTLIHYGKILVIAGLIIWHLKVIISLCPDQMNQLSENCLYTRITKGFQCKCRYEEHVEMYTSYTCQDTEHFIGLQCCNGTVRSSEAIVSDGGMITERWIGSYHPGAVPERLRKPTKNISFKNRSGDWAQDFPNKKQKYYPVHRLKRSKSHWHEPLFGPCLRTSLVELVETFLLWRSYLDIQKINLCL
jgi:hypothetical protein